MVESGASAFSGNASGVVVRGVTKVHTSKNGAVVALDNVSFEVARGEFISIVGPSGCGKTTLLYLLAGFEQPTAGEILVNGRSIHGAGADRGVVFQEYCLFPWLSVQKNVEFGLRIRGVSGEARTELANRMICRVGLDGFQTALPYQLSGGMKQRCALARCFANNPEVLLLDEPLGAVDALTREDLQDEIQKMWWADGDQRKSIVNITHSIDEAVYLSDRVIVLSHRPGRIKSIIEVTLPRPRTDHIRFTVEFQRLVEEIKGALKSLN